MPCEMIRSKYFRSRARWNARMLRVRWWCKRFFLPDEVDFRDLLVTQDGRTSFLDRDHLCAITCGKFQWHAFANNNGISFTWKLTSYASARTAKIGRESGRKTKGFNKNFHCYVIFFLGLIFMPLTLCF